MASQVCHDQWYSYSHKIQWTIALPMGSPANVNTKFRSVEPEQMLCYDVSGTALAHLCNMHKITQKSGIMPRTMSCYQKKVGTQKSSAWFLLAHSGLPGYILSQVGQSGQGKSKADAVGKGLRPCRSCDSEESSQQERPTSATNCK